jgi:hypothetical protein
VRPIRRTKRILIIVGLLALAGGIVALFDGSIRAGSAEAIVALAALAISYLFKRNAIWSSRAAILLAGSNIIAGVWLLGKGALAPETLVGTLFGMLLNCVLCSNASDALFGARILDHLQRMGRTWKDETRSSERIANASA